MGADLARVKNNNKETVCIQVFRLCFTCFKAKNSLLDL